MKLQLNFETVRIACAKKRISLAKLARELDIAQATLYSWQSVPEKVQLRHVARISEVLGVDPDSLIQKAA